jgi:membrane associated rhomboid family serine protease
MPIIPLGDDNPHGGSSPLNWSFIIAALGFLAYAFLKDHDLSLQALLPFTLPPEARLPLAASQIKPFLTGLFIHQNPWQMALYLYMLWMLGDNIEYAMGHIRYLVFFLLCGFGGLLAKIWLAHQGNELWFTGMGAAAFAVTGAYIACFPRIQINIIWFFEENYLSVKSLPLIFLFTDALLGLRYPVDSFKEIIDLPVLQHLTVSGIHLLAFVVGYGLFFVFRDKSIVIDMPTHFRTRVIRTGGTHDWR